MFFNSLDEVEKIAKNNGASLFIIPDNFEIKIAGAITVKPEEKTTITIEQIRDATAHFAKKQVSNQYIIIRPADKIGKEAQNAFLKNLEEPTDKVHYILISNQPSRLLPTILSRVSIYFLRSDFDLKTISCADEKQKNLAKKLIAAKPNELVALSKEITGKKEHVRNYVLEILSIAIEMLYKTYLINNKQIFLQKLPKFIKAYEDINMNGNIKLSLVANLL